MVDEKLGVGLRLGPGGLDIAVVVDKAEAALRAAVARVGAERLVPDKVAANVGHARTAQGAFAEVDVCKGGAHVRRHGGAPQHSAVCRARRL